MHNLKGKKILITGGSGFLGSHLAEACFLEEAILYGVDIYPPFNKNIWKAFSTVGLVSDESEELFKHNSFEIIFHLAGGASVSDSVQFPEKDFNTLLPITLRLIQLIKTYCPKTHLILFSSAAVYGNPDVIPVKETATLHPLSPYGIHKALVEEMVKYYSAYFNFRSSVLRIFSAFGEGLRKQLFWDVMCRYEKSLKEDKDEKMILSLFGTGHESRDFIHSKDVAKAAILVAISKKTDTDFCIFNVAGGEETSIKNAVKYLFSKAEINPFLTFTGTTRAGDPERWQADISKLKQLGFEAQIELKDSLSGYYNWFMNLDKK